MSANPFLDSTLVHGDLYQGAARLTDRTHALHQAKISGSNVADAIADLLASRIRSGAVVLDIGCGRGTTTLRLANRLRPGQLVAVDASAALLDTTRSRLGDAGARGVMVCADFHRLPLPDNVADAAVAAFCLYHSPTPAAVVAEIARCLRPGGVVVLVTKSLDSYVELDRLVHTAGLDPGATNRPSLYESFHSGNLHTVAASSLTVLDVQHEDHVFGFADATHLARYLTTTPKYRITLTGGIPALAAALRQQ
ncbi:class I SAM-dependent methyltransferase, partial [Micromonospora echinofusca]